MRITAATISPATATKMNPVLQNKIKGNRKKKKYSVMMKDGFVHEFDYIVFSLAELKKVIEKAPKGSAILWNDTTRSSFNKIPDLDQSDSKFHFVQSISLSHNDKETYPQKWWKIE